MSLLARHSDSIPGDLANALRRAFLEAPSPATEERHLAMIEAAEESVAAAAPEPHSSALSPKARWSVRSTRIRVVAMLASGLVALPVAFAGLAFAGVSLPDPVDSAFETVGIDLPNQPDRADDDANRAGDRDEGSAGGGGAVGGDPESSDEESDVEGGGSTGANRADGGKAPDSNGKPSRTDDENGRPVHAQDEQTGAPAHSEQGGQGVGTPPPHAQDGVGAPPPQAQDGGSEKSESVMPAPPAPKPVKPTPEPD
jgi:hypothetical protein